MTVTSTFVETQFPTDISYGSTGGSAFNTTIFEASSGWEQRNINWSVSKAKYDVSYSIKSKSQMDALVNFFMAMNGRAYSFRFKDWGDYQIANQVIGTGNSVATTFQLVKSYGVGSRVFTRTIKKPVANTVTYVTVGGTVIPQGSGAGKYTLDTTTGIFTFGTPPTVGLPIVVQYIEFDVPVRFDVDELNLKQEFWTYESWDGIRLVETRQ